MRHTVCFVCTIVSVVLLYIYIHIGINSMCSLYVVPNLVHVYVVVICATREYETPHRSVIHFMMVFSRYR